MPPSAITSHRSAFNTCASTASDARQALASKTWTRWPSRIAIDASSAIPYGTWRGSSSSRMTGLMKSTLAMHELLERHGLDLGAAENAALGAVDGLAVGLARHLEEGVAKPVVGRIGEPRLSGDRILDTDERLIETVAEELAQLGVVLRLLVLRARRVAEVHADQRDPAAAEHRVRQHPGGGADVAAAVQARQAVLTMQATREAIGLVVVVVHRIPPVERHAR